MAKRFQPLKEFGRTTKKPKLDIIINSNSHIASTGKSSLANQNLWCDDDDDDVILLATQVAETHAAAAQVNGQCIDNIFDSEMTFSEFIPNVHSSTSTQRPPVASATAAAPTSKQNIASELFDDDDDDFALMAALVNENMEQPESVIAAVEEHDLFKKPTGKNHCSGATGTYVNNTNSTLSHRPSDGVGAHVYALSDQTTARCQLATERQIKFLMEQIEKFKKENTELSKNLSDTKSKMEIRDGEASLLRDELKHMKQQVQTLKIEKIYSTEAAKAESKTRIAELSKTVKAKESELQLKSVECSVLKMRHADETKRFEKSMRDVSMCVASTGAEAIPHEEGKHSGRRKIDKVNRTLNRLTGLNLYASSTKITESITIPIQLRSEFLFEETQERGITKMQRTLFQVELELMQTIVAQLQQERLIEDTHSYCARIIASVRKVFSEFWSYVHSLEFPKSCRTHSYHDYELQKDSSEYTRHCLLQPDELFEEERALNLRRYISILSVVCQLLPPLTGLLLTQPYEKYVLLQIAIDAIIKLSYAREVCEHFGLLEAFAVLLHSMLLNMSTNNVVVTDEQLKLLVTLFKQLVFVRPSAWIFRELTRCLLQCAQVPKALPLLCVKSEAGCFVYDRNQSLYRFSNNSCILQVYAVLLETSFPLINPLHVKHFELLTVICDNHIRFVYQCFAQPPEFIFHLLPSYDERDEEEGNAKESIKLLSQSQPSTITKQRISQDSTNSENGSRTAVDPRCEAVGKTDLNKGSCECYTKLCLSVVTLLFQLLHQWVLSKRTWHTARVSEISKLSVQLLYIIFCDNYLTCLFRNNEQTTKHYLYLICEWWVENSELLHFNQVHLNFLQKLKNSHVMPRLIAAESNLDNISRDLKEWCRITNDTAPYTNEDIAKSANMNNLLPAGDEEKFFKGLQGYAFNFQ